MNEVTPITISYEAYTKGEIKISLDVIDGWRIEITPDKKANVYSPMKCVESRKKDS